MRYYYNGQLVRTSDHVYTHAIVDLQSGECVACRSSYKACESLLNSSLHRLCEGIENTKRKIDAIVAGAPYYVEKMGKRTFRSPANPARLEEAQKWYEEAQTRLEHQRNNWKIVELEME